MSRAWSLVRPFAITRIIGFSPAFQISVTRFTLECRLGRKMCAFTAALSLPIIKLLEVPRINININVVVSHLLALFDPNQDVEISGNFSGCWIRPNPNPRRVPANRDVRMRQFDGEKLLECRAAKPREIGEREKIFPPPTSSQKPCGDTLRTSTFIFANYQTVVRKTTAVEFQFLTRARAVYPLAMRIVQVPLATAATPSRSGAVAVAARRGVRAAQAGPALRRHHGFKRRQTFCEGGAEITFRFRL